MRSLWPTRIRWRLIAGVALVHLVLMTAFVVDLVARDRRFLADLSRQEVESLAKTLAVTSNSWLLANDVAGLQELVRSTQQYPNLRYAMVVDHRGEILAHTDPTRLGLYVADAPGLALLRSEARAQVLHQDGRLLDVAAPVFASTGECIGWVRVGLGQEQISASLRFVTRNGVLYTLLAILIGSAIATLIGRQLTAGLQELETASAAIRAGRREVRVPPDRAEEIAQVGNAFNQMLDAIDAKERQLQRSMEEVRDLYDRAPCGYHSLDGDGLIVQINDTELKWLGYARDEVVGKKRALDLLSPHSAEVFLRSYPAFKASGHLQDLELDFVRKDGTLLNALVSASAVSDATGRFVMSRSTVYDITDRKRLEAQLLQSQKMESVGQLAGGVAHDFNNLLTAILGYGDLLLADTRPGDPVRANVEPILDAARKAAEVTKGLLAFSRKQVLHKRTVRLHQLIRDLERLLARLIREDVRITTALAADDPVIDADAGQIQQVLVNLSTNARDAMPRGGTLSFTTSVAQIDDAFVAAHGLGAPGRYACVRVGDTGLGMSAATRARIFEPFFTTKEAGKGTGLGLAMVYGILNQHDGFVQVESEPGQGTTFSLYLPLARGGAAAIAPPEEEGEAQGGTETLLLAEDDRELRRLWMALLAKAGYTVVAAADGEEAVEQFLRHRATVRLCILDLIMPRKGGREAAQLIAACGAQVKMLFASGHSPDAETVEALARGGHQLVAKPISTRALLRKVREVLDEGTARQAAAPA